MLVLGLCVSRLARDSGRTLQLFGLNIRYAVDDYTDNAPVILVTEKKRGNAKYEQY